jgi:hypothetical protein
MQNHQSALITTTNRNTPIQNDLVQILRVQEANNPFPITVERDVLSQQLLNELAVRNSQNDHVRARRLAYFDSQNISSAEITPQEVLPQNFFNPEIGPINRLLDSINISDQRMAEGIVSDNFSNNVSGILHWDMEYTNALENTISREFLIFLNENVEHIEPIESGVFNNLFDSLVSLFNFQHLELTITYFFAIFPPLFLLNIIYRLSNGGPDIIYIRFVSFLVFFRPMLLRFTNVRVWARFNFLGPRSLYEFFIGILRSASFSFRSFRPFQFSFNILDRLPEFNRILSDGNTRIRELVRTATEVDNMRFSWSLFRYVCVTTSLGLIIYQWGQNPTAVILFVNALLRKVGLFFDFEVISGMLSALLKTPQSNPNTHSPNISLGQYLNELFQSYPCFGFEERLLVVLEILKDFF